MDLTKGHGQVIRWLLMLFFGAATSVLISFFDAPGLTRLDLLGLAGGTAAIFTAMIWFFLIAIDRSFWWGLAMLIPYVNLIAASYYARWYWREGARAPALLGLAGIFAQTVTSLALLQPTLPALV